MAIYALYVIASGAKVARRLSCNAPQGQEFVFVRFVGMRMRTVISIRTVISEEVDVAHVDFLYSFDFAFVVRDHRVNSLSVFVARNAVHVRWRRLRS